MEETTEQKPVENVQEAQSSEQSEALQPATEGTQVAEQQN